MHARIAAFENRDKSRTDELVGLIRDRQSAGTEIPDALGMYVLVDRSAGAMLGEGRSAHRRGEADVARLRNLKIRSPLHPAARSTGFLARDRLTVPTPHWRARLTGTYRVYLARRSAKTRTLLAGDRAAGAMLRRRDQLPRALRLPRQRAEAWR